MRGRVARSRPTARGVTRWALLGVLVLVASLAGPVGPASAVASPVALEAFQVQNVRHGKCLDAHPDQVGQNGGLVHLWTCHSGWWQRWYFLGDQTVRTPGPPVGPADRCLDAWPVGAGWRVSMWTCNGGTQQKWNVRLTGLGYVLESVRWPGMCLDTPWDGGGDGSPVTMYACHHDLNQQWRSISA